VTVLRHPVVVFDLDGTLLRGTTASLVIAESMGHRAAVEELERFSRTCEISNHEWTAREAALFAGTHPAQMCDHLRGAPWIGGLRETFVALTDAGCTLLLATLAWRFVTEALEHRPWFAAVSGAEMELEGSLLSGTKFRHFDEEDKLRFVECWCTGHGYQLADVAAIGDSRSDVPLFQKVGTAIALNATSDAKAAADHILDTDDLRDILPLLQMCRDDGDGLATGPPGQPDGEGVGKDGTEPATMP
jgi:phosphoserine phosphatase